MTIKRVKSNELNGRAHSRKTSRNDLWGREGERERDNSRVTEGSPGSRKEGIRESATRLRPRPFRKSLEIAVNEPCD